MWLVAGAKSPGEVQVTPLGNKICVWSIERRVEQVNSRKCPGGGGGGSWAGTGQVPRRGSWMVTG